MAFWKFKFIALIFTLTNSLAGKDKALYHSALSDDEVICKKDPSYSNQNIIIKNYQEKKFIFTLKGNLPLEENQKNYEKIFDVDELLKLKFITSRLASNQNTNIWNIKISVLDTANNYPYVGIDKNLQFQKENGALIDFDKIQNLTFKFIYKEDFDYNIEIQYINDLYSSCKNFIIELIPFDCALYSFDIINVEKDNNACINGK